MNISGINKRTTTPAIVVNARQIIGTNDLYKGQNATRFHIDETTGFIHNIKPVYSFVRKS